VIEMMIRMRKLSGTKMSKDIDVDILREDRDERRRLALEDTRILCPIGCEHNCGADNCKNYKGVGR